MKVNITKAHELTGRSRTTIYKHVKSGKLSATGTKDEGFEIDIAELDRVYGLKKQASDDASTDAHPVHESTATGEQELKAKLALLGQQVEMLADERRREREQMQEHIDRLEDIIRGAQDQHTRLTALLTDQRGEKDTKAREEQARLIRDLKMGQGRLRQELLEMRSQRSFLARWLGIGGTKKDRQPRPLRSAAGQQGT